jgi:hypothetical protein
MTASEGSTVVEHPTTKCEMEGSNPASIMAEIKDL